MAENNKEFDILDFATKAQQVIEKNFKVLLVIFLVAIGGGAVWSWMAGAEQAKEQEAFTKLFEITKIYEKKKADYLEAKAEKEKKPDSKKEGEKKEEPKSDLVEASGVIEKDYPEVPAKLEAFLDANQGRNASGEAALILSEIYEEYNMPDKGAEALSKALKTWKEKNVLYYVMQMRTGDLWASKGQCENATSYWTVVANSESFISTQAQLKLGVCLQEMGKLDQAKKWFTQIKEKNPKSAEAFSASRYLRFLEFKTKMEEESPAESNGKAQQNDEDQDTPS